MKYIIFVLLILVIAFMYFYYERKLVSTKKRLLSISKQFNILRNEYRKSITLNENIKVKFLTPSFKTAIANNNSNIYIAPLSNSPKVKVLDIKMEVTILDSVLINNNVWFYVNLPIDSDYNCRGWINKSDLLIVYSDSQNISNPYK